MEVLIITTLVVLKVMLAPTLIALSTFVVYWRGETAGGWLLGLPLVSGPVSVLLFLEHGYGFARTAAGGALLGLVAAAAFCSAYVLIATRQSWWKCLIAATVACAATAVALVGLHPSLAGTIALVLLVLGTLPWVMGAPRGSTSRTAPTAPDLLAKMIVATLVVFAITTAAGFLGAKIAGALAPLPIITAVMAVSLHRAQGHEVADNLLRGTVAGTWGGAAFFSVVVLIMAPGYAVETYVLATVAAVAGAMVAALVQSAPERELGGERFPAVDGPVLASLRTRVLAPRAR